MGRYVDWNSLMKNPVKIITVNVATITNKKLFLEGSIKLPPSAKPVNIELKPDSISNDSGAWGSKSDIKRAFNTNAKILNKKSILEKISMPKTRIIPDRILGWNKISATDLKYALI